MPLFTMSSNVQEVDAGVRKRSHEEFAKPDSSEPQDFREIGLGVTLQAPVKSIVSDESKYPAHCLPRNFRC
jgi:hypothetical protein